MNVEGYEIPNQSEGSSEDHRESVAIDDEDLEHEIRHIPRFE